METYHGAIALSSLDVFARKASGLVREASVFDAFLFAFMNIGAASSLWVVSSWGAYLYPSGNLLGGTIFAAILFLVGYSLVWGMLGGSMPRSGGSYIYSSRIVSPAVGVAISFGDVFVLLLYNGTLAPWTIDPGLTTWLNVMGASQDLTSAVTSPAAMFILVSLILVWTMFVIFGGMKTYLRVQRIIGVLALVSLATTVMVYFTVTPDSFKTIWDARAAEYGSLTYLEMIEAAKNADPTLFAPTFSPLMGMMGLIVVNSWLYHYGFASCWVAGEVKRPQRNVLISQISGVVVPALFAIPLLAIMPHVAGSDFVRALAAADNIGLDGYAMPVAPNFVGVASLLTDNWILRAVLGSAIFWALLMWPPVQTMGITRMMLAWGLDRMGPSWFSEVSTRWGSPVKNLIFIFIVSEMIAAIYIFLPEYLVLLAAGVSEAVSVWAVTAIAALIFPFRSKVKHIWEASPYSRWRIGIPVICIAGAVELFAVCLMVYFFFANPALGGYTDIALVFFGGIWIIGALWFYLWRWKWRREGIDIDMAWKQLPPE